MFCCKHIKISIFQNKVEISYKLVIGLILATGERVGQAYTTHASWTENQRNLEEVIQKKGVETISGELVSNGLAN